MNWLVILSFPSFAQEMGINTRQILEMRARNRMAQTEGEVREGLRIRGVETKNLRSTKDSYRISADRFTESHLKGHNLNIISEQVDEAVRFINDLYVDTHGIPDELTIREIRIRPLSAMPEKVRFTQQGETLYLGMPPQKKGFTVMSSEELRAMFNQGLQLEKDSPVRKVWKHLNPVGETRTQLRNSLQKLSKKVGTELGELKKRHLAEETPDSLRSEILSFIESKTKLSREEVEKLKGRLENKTVPELLQFLSHWESYVEDPSNIQINTSHSTGGNTENVRDNKITILGGLVGWGNQKRFRIIFSVSSGGKEDNFKMPIPSRDTTKVLTTGLLYSHWTEDTVDVTVIHTDGGIIHSGLLHAMGRLRK